MPPSSAFSDNFELERSIENAWKLLESTAEEHRSVNCASSEVGRLIPFQQVRPSVRRRGHINHSESQVLQDPSTSCGPEERATGSSKAACRSSCSRFLFAGDEGSCRQHARLQEVAPCARYVSAPLECHLGHTLGRHIAACADETTCYLGAVPRQP